MAYRLNNTPPPKPENMLPRFEVRNGAIIDIAFPCYYLDVLVAHDSHYHDHIGWPAPNFHGQACQFIDGLSFHEHAKKFEHIDWVHPHPIDLLSEYEGYDAAYVTTDEDVESLGLTLSARLDESEHNVVYLRAKANLDTFEDKPKDFRFTVFLHAPARTYQGNLELEKMDQVIRGMITVLPGTKH